MVSLRVWSTGSHSTRLRSSGPEFHAYGNDSLSAIVAAVPRFGLASSRLLRRETLPRKADAQTGTHSSWKHPLRRRAERHFRNVHAEQKARNPGCFLIRESSASIDLGQRIGCSANPLWEGLR